MLNPFKEVNWHPSLAERRKFGWSLAIGFPSIAIVLLVGIYPWSGVWRVMPFMWLAGCGIALGLLFVAVPLVAGPFYFIWHCLSCGIGMVIGNALLAAFYLLVITPFGVVMRVFGREVVSKRPDSSMKSYWLDVDKPGDVKDYYRQF